MIPEARATRSNSLGCLADDSLMPLYLLHDWLDRCPEARKIIDEMAGEKFASKSNLPGQARNCHFRALIGGQYQEMTLVDVVGHILKARKKGQSVSVTYCVTAEQIHEEDKEKVRQAASFVDGSTVQLYFEENDSVVIPQ